MAGKVRYPDWQTWQFVALLTLRNGRIWRETDYSAAPFDAPAWRSEYVERDEHPGLRGAEFLDKAWSGRLRRQVLED